MHAMQRLYHVVAMYIHEYLKIVLFLCTQKFMLYVRLLCTISTSVLPLWLRHVCTSVSTLRGCYAGLREAPVATAVSSSVTWTATARAATRAIVTPATTDRSVRLPTVTHYSLLCSNFLVLLWYLQHYWLYR